jgi:ParB family chromosome partitioning protein
MGHGRALINIDRVEKQLLIYERILKDKLSVRQTEDFVKELKSPASSKNEIKSSTPTFVKTGMPTISEFFGHKISVSVNAKGKGKISIPFHSEEDFNRIKKLLE